MMMALAAELLLMPSSSLKNNNMRKAQANAKTSETSKAGKRPVPGYHANQRTTRECGRVRAHHLIVSVHARMKTPNSTKMGHVSPRSGPVKNTCGGKGPRRVGKGEGGVIRRKRWPRHDDG